MAPPGPASAPEAGIASFDPDRWRGDTPGCAQRVHLDNAGVALVPRPVPESSRSF